MGFGGKLLVWEEPEGVIRITKFPTLTEIGAAEAQRTTGSQSR